MFSFPVALVTCNGAGGGQFIKPEGSTEGVLRVDTTCPASVLAADAQTLKTQALTPLSPQRRVEEERQGHLPSLLVGVLAGAGTGG